MTFSKYLCFTFITFTSFAVFSKPPVPPDQEPVEVYRDCLLNSEAIARTLPDINIPDLFKTEVKESKFCVDVKQYSAKDPKQKELIEEYKILDVSGAIDSDGCIKEEAKLGNLSGMINDFIKKNIEVMPVKMLIGVDDKNDSVRLNFAVQSEKKFESTSLSTKDKWQIAGLSSAGIVAGALVSEAMYKGQEDKRKHWMVGATISGVATGTTYLVLETAGLGDKLGMSAKAKKRAILLSGPIMGTIAGILKEVYDDRNRKKHTVDAHDAAATSLGAGVVVPIVVNFAF